MDWSDLPQLCFAAPLVLLLLFLLTILLRVACHFTSTDIPALGRAFFTTAAVAGLNAFFVYLAVAVLIGFGRSQPSIERQLLVVFLGIVANLLLALGLYRLLLQVTWHRAFRIWLWQASLFLVLTLVLGCCAGVGSLVLD